MKLDFFLTSGVEPDLRPAPATREWMDATPQRFAYRCLPLSIANAHGWEVLCKGDVRIAWNGKDGLDAIRVTTSLEEPFRPVSVFGSGIFTFHVAGLIRTEPGYDLWVSGPPNTPKPNVYPLSGVIETDWSPFSFTMNWKFTTPNSAVLFRKGEPFCFFFPVRRGDVEAFEPVIRDIRDEPELYRDFAAWSQGRRDFLTDLRERHVGRDGRTWQGHYFRGEDFEAEKQDVDHRTKLRLRPFRKA